jgi:hypothetical protein
MDKKKMYVYCVYKFFIDPVISMIAGFGVFWWFIIFKQNVFAAIIFGLLTAAYMEGLFNEIENRG